MFRALAASVAFITFILTYTGTLIAQFDSSAQIVSNSTLTQTLLRWDVFHFLHIAQDSYVYEHEWAFLQATPLLMSLFPRLATYLGFMRDASPSLMVLSGSIAALAVSLHTPHVLYELTKEHFGSTRFATTAALLSLIPSSPATFFLAPYNEPFFTYLSYKGMLSCSRSRWWRASVYFALASCFRSNGLMLGGFIIWGQLIEPFLEHRRITPCSVLRVALQSTLIFLPLTLHHVRAYAKFCFEDDRPEWCMNIPPSIYSYVQEKYWDNGFLRYWTVQQIPNFIISIPPLLLIYVFSIHHLHRSFIPRLKDLSWTPKITGSKAAQGSSSSTPGSIHNDRDQKGAQEKKMQEIQKQKSVEHPYWKDSITPHAIHAIIFSSTLLFASNTQIVLRLAASMPFTYWAASWLVVEHPKIGQWWVGWSVIWGAVSCVLWGAFLPPA